MPYYSDSSLIIERDLENKQGVYSLLQSVDKNIRDVNNDLYIFCREVNNNISDIQNAITNLKKAEAENLMSKTISQNDISELKANIKELQRDISDIKGDIKAISAGFNSAQTRFNWGLVILGMIIALIQLLK